MNLRASATKRGTPRYQQIFEKLSQDILAGKYKQGQKLPSEAVLVRKFDASRITVGRAVRELKERGLVRRIAGSGTYVNALRAIEGQSLFGLLIPDLGGTEIFEPICQGIAGATSAYQYALLWGRTELERATKEEQALDLCNQFVKRGVSGVFFAPLELTPDKDQTNQAIVTELEKAHIPVVLLDRCIMPFPKHGKHDVVGIDNRRAAFMVTEHLLKLGCRRTIFVAYPNGAPTVDARIAGFREALSSFGVPWDADFVQMLPTITEVDVKRLLDTLRPEAFVCVNDQSAGLLMHAVLNLGYQIPRDVRIVGIDDVEYAKLLPVPLTTIHQPCREIGQAAMAAMLDRIRDPNMLARDILLDCRLVVRASCGSAS